MLSCVLKCYNGFDAILYMILYTEQCMYIHMLMLKTEINMYILYTIQSLQLYYI